MTSKSSAPSRTPHLDAANRYIKDVLSGAIPACKWVKAACQRQVDDLKRQKGKAWPYRFDKEAAERVCRFLECLPHIKGPLARQRKLMKLEPWQCFVVTTAYGWLHKAGKLKGKRRFRRLYLEVPRGNGKSFLLSGLSLYALAADKENGAEVYSAAVSKDQAKIIFDSSRQMVRKRPSLREKLGLKTVRNAITREKTASTFKPLASDADNLDGLNVHFAAIDELHAHQKRAVYDVVESGMGKRDQPMLVVITTAGNDRAGICYEVRGYVLKILQQAHADEAWFGIIYTIDIDESKSDGEDEKGDDWREESTWRKANPNWGTSVDPTHIAGMATKAMQLPSAQPNFKTKHLNVWVNAATAWMNIATWNKCADPTLAIENFEGEACKIALDLASVSDIAAKAYLFSREIDGKTHFYYFGRYYLPAATIEEGRNSQYEGWRIAGLLTETEGNAIDFDLIEDAIKDDDAKTFGPIEVAYDPWQARQLAQHLEADGIPTIEYRQILANMSAPMKEVEAAVLGGRFHHNGCPLMTWMVSNVVCYRDAKDNVYPRKERDENKIDGPVALIMAMGRHLAEGETAGGSIYDDPGFLGSD